jgi:MFS family permease
MVHVPITPVEAIAAIGTFLGISWLIPTVMCVRGLCCPLDGDGGPGGGALGRALPPPSLSRGSEQIARRGIPHATAPLLAQQPAAVPPPPVKNWRLTLALLILAATIENSLTLTTFSVESLAAHNITGEAATSTLPTTSRLLGATMAAGPASLLMGRVGRRLGFVVGAVLAVLGALVCALAVHMRSFYLLLAGSVLAGSEAGFGGFLRFAAAEVVSADMRPRAISWIVAASVAAAVLGPRFAQATRALLPPVEFVGTYIAVAALAVVYIFVLAANTGLPKPSVAAGGGSQSQAPERKTTICELLHQPGFVVALLGQVGGNMAMVFIMVAMPVVMSGLSFHYTTIADVVTVHALGMYVPGFVTGELIRVSSTARVMMVGALVYLGAVIVGLSGVTGAHFFGTLFLAGLGWNLVFTSGSAMLVEVVPKKDIPRAQGVSESMTIVRIHIPISTPPALRACQRIPWHDMGISSFIIMALPQVGACSGTIGSGLVWGWFGEWSMIMWFAGAGPVLIVSCTAMAGLFIEQEQLRQRLLRDADVGADGTNSIAHSSKGQFLEQQQQGGGGGSGDGSE